MTLDTDDYPLDDNDLEQIFQDEVIPDEYFLVALQTDQERWVRPR